MAINIPILTEFSDAGLKSAQGAFNNFKAKVGEAEGAMGKFKAGGNAALDAVKANAGMFAAAAGAAIAGFAIKAIGEFQDLALEVDKFANSTGLAAEEASRWIEVAGDIGVESGTLLSAINKLNRAVGDNSEAFAELGVEIVRTSTGATDVNATFLATIDALRKIDDPAKRARLATQTLGKSWTELSELVQMGSKNLSSALAEVSGAKVIDEREIQKAKDLRAAQDALADAFDELVLTVGQELVPAFINATNAVQPLVDLIGPLTKATLGAADANASWAEQALNNQSSFRIFSGVLELFNKVMGRNTDEVEENAEVTEEMVKAWRDGYRAMINANTAAKQLATSTDDLTYEWERLLGVVNEQDAWNNLVDQFQQVQDKSFEALVSGAAEDLRTAQREANDLTRDIARYVQELGTIPPNIQSQIIAALDRGAFDEAIRLLENIRRGAVAPITGTVGGIPVGPGETPSEVRPPGSRPPGFRPPAKLPTIPIGTPGGAGKYSAVTVNVSGSVISDNDLVETVRKGLVNAQRNGAGLVYTNR